MATPVDVRRIRIANDYKEMVTLRRQGSMVSWRALSGAEPHVDDYEITVRVRSFISRTETRDSHTVHVKLPGDYPIAPPRIVMTSLPVVFHPNWWPDARWCYGTWSPSESLGQHIIRMIETLQFDLEITNPASPANKAANDWFLEMLSRQPGKFPCDRQPLPDPTRIGVFNVKGTKKTFTIRTD